jgi:hypothetical protein
MSMQIPLALSPRRAVLLLAALALLAVGVLTLASASGAGARPVAHLALAKRDPVTVTGRGFRPRIRVHLLLTDQGTLASRPLTSRNGTFTATFQTTLDRCSNWSVTATQPGRAMVILRSPAKPECAPMSPP